MQLRETILEEHSKTNCNRITKWIGDNQYRFDELFYLFLHDDNLVVQRAAWPLSYAVEAHPHLIKRHLGKLISHLKKPKIHIAVKRNTTRLLQYIIIPKRFHGEIMNLCFDYINSQDEAIAVKAFSLGILQNLSKQYPDIKQELKTIIESRWDYESAAFRSRAKKILKELRPPAKG
jgi:hypothetical protein